MTLRCIPETRKQVYYRLPMVMQPMSLWQLFLNNPEWALVGVGIVTFIFIGWQAVATAMAAKATQQAAEATQDSAEAIERQIGIMERQTKAMEDAAHATEKSVELAADSAQRQLRAYVCVSSALVKFYGSMFEAQVHIKNSGPTPAYDVRQWIHVWIEGYPLKIVLPEAPEGFKMSSSIIPPSGTSIMICGRDAQTIIPPNVTLGSPQATVYIYGEIRYLDAFRIERKTRYRMIWGGPESGRKTFSRTENAFIGVCQTDYEGNDAN